ncbi:hypothetical protein [Yersinia intermedia]|uniref:hypothetical protein n=1 Tax=Yersinia intermedia TaxID=631 RepID=UPI00065D5551|nr:hypothetical protein [Yersinia intermedia]CRY84212.1 Uncharacterised protein [Yersinia intermedia]
MKLFLIASTWALATFTLSASSAEEKPPRAPINLEPCEQLTKDAILSAIPPQVTITLEQYKKSAGTLGMVCWLGIQDGYEGKSRNPLKFGAMGKEGVGLYLKAYDNGVKQSGLVPSLKPESESKPNQALSDFYNTNGFNVNNRKEIEYADTLWGAVMHLAKSVQVKPTGETCYLIITQDRNGRITGTRSDGGKSPSGNGPEGDVYCKAVESAFTNVSMPPVPKGVKSDFDVLSLTYIFEDTSNR